MTKNKAGYTAQDAPSMRFKISGDGRTDGPTDTTSYRDATAHLKIERKNNRLASKLKKEFHNKNKRIPLFWLSKRTSIRTVSLTTCDLNIWTDGRTNELTL